MPWKESCVMDQRMHFVVEYDLDELTMAQLCRQYGISRKTGYKWLARIERGPEGLRDLSRAPRHHPNQVPPGIEELVLDLRVAHPTWGPRKLLALLQRRDGRRAWPARSTIAALLRRRGLAAPRKRRRRVPPQEQPFGACDGPNAVWCADFKGWFRTGDGRRCDPLTISDAYSRYLLRCQVLDDCGTYESVWPICQAAFSEYGLPGAIRTDNGPPFASRGVAGLSRLSLEWIKLGIRHERIDAGQPQQNGRHERMHQTLKQDAASPPAANGRSQQRRFDRFSREFNQERPHEALGMATPASVYEPSGRVHPGPVGDLRYPAGWACRRVGTKGKLHWNGREVFLGDVLHRELVGLEPLDGRYWRVYFGPVALGILDEHERRILRPGEALGRGLDVIPQAQEPPSAALQEAPGQ